MLTAISRLLADACRGSDVAARWGGEEFVMLLPETGLSQARQLAERLRLSIDKALSFRDGRKPFHVSASFGIAELGEHRQLDELIAEADDWALSRQATRPQPRRQCTANARRRPYGMTARACSGFLSGHCT